MDHNQICMPSNYFAIFILAGTCIIIFALWQVNQQANQIRQLTENHRLNTETLTDNLEDMIAQKIRSSPQQNMPRPSPPPNFDQGVMQRQRDYQRIADPLTPPLQSSPFSGMYNPAPAPVNIPTRGEYQPFQQVGFAHKKGISDQMFPIFGRYLYSSKYEYYVVHPLSQIKIPIRIKNDWELSQDDLISIPGFPGEFHVEIYDIDQPRYIPY